MNNINPTERRDSVEEKRTREVAEANLARVKTSAPEYEVNILAAGNLLPSYAAKMHKAMADKAQIRNAGILPDLDKLASYMADRVRDRIHHTRMETGKAQFKPDEKQIAIPAFLATWMKLIGRAVNPNHTLELVPCCKGDYELSVDEAYEVSAQLESCAEFGFTIVKAFPYDRSGSIDFMMLSLLQNELTGALEVHALHDTPLALAIPAAVLGVQNDFEYYSKRSFDVNLGFVDAIDNILRSVMMQ